MKHKKEELRFQGRAKLAEYLKNNTELYEKMLASLDFEGIE